MFCVIIFSNASKGLMVKLLYMYYMFIFHPITSFNLHTSSKATMTIRTYIDVVSYLKKRMLCLPK